MKVRSTAKKAALKAKLATLQTLSTSSSSVGCRAGDYKLPPATTILCQFRQLAWANHVVCVSQKVLNVSERQYDIQIERVKNSTKKNGTPAASRIPQRPRLKDKWLEQQRPRKAVTFSNTEMNSHRANHNSNRPSPPLQHSKEILSTLRAPNFQHISSSSPHVNHQKEIQSILQILKHLKYVNCPHLLGRKNRSNNWQKLRIVSTTPCSNSLSNKVWWHQPYHSPVCSSSAEIPSTTVTLCAPLSIR